MDAIIVFSQGRSSWSNVYSVKSESVDVIFCTQVPFLCSSAKQLMKLVVASGPFIEKM